MIIRRSLNVYWWVLLALSSLFSLSANAQAANPEYHLGSGDTLRITVPVQQNRVLILGSVRTPGAHDLEEGARLLDGIAAAGGPLERSGTNNVGLIRNGADGKPAVTKVDLNKIMKGDLAQNMALRQGDVVYIPQGPLVRWQEVLSWITSLTILRSVTSGTP